MKHGDGSLVSSYLIDAREPSPRFQIPGHGTTTENPDEIKKRISNSKYYLDQLPHDNGELENYLSEEYAFFQGMKGIHSENKKIANQEKE